MDFKDTGVDEMYEYDVAVIGGGPGGYVAALDAGLQGASVVLIEKDRRLGGTCLLRGCIPSKTMVKTAELLAEMRHPADFGVNGSAEPNWEGIVARKDKVVSGLTSGINDLCKARKVVRLEGTGRILSPGSVLVQGSNQYSGAMITVRAKNIIVATGSATVLGTEIRGGDSPRVITSDEILDMDLTLRAMPALPKSMVVIGGGIVGMEFASIFAAYGTKVTAVITSPRILRNVDDEIARRFAQLLKQAGVETLLKTTVEEFRDRGDHLEVVVQTEGTAEPRVLNCEYALYAKGRVPYTQGLGLEELGVTTQRGYIPTDEYMRTNVAGIYAIGDVVPGHMLAHVASYEGEVAVDHILGHARKADYRAVPDCIFTIPEIASVGLTEALAKEKGIPVRVTKFPFAALGRAQAIGEPHGLVKLV
ncbi:MAG TPA: dihydrolipoyl dehydrogenase, partial [Chloroflexia bacterium]|nr:dihydrolipoyl dehydrogenase [Chloroflexia bacterium]